MKVDFETPRFTFSAILEMIRNLDEGLFDFEGFEIDPSSLGEDLRDKVDGIVTVLDNLEMRASLFRKRAQELTNKARSLENNAERLRTYAAEQMAKDAKIRGIDSKYRVSGYDYEFLLQHSEQVEIHVEPTSKHLFDLGENFVRRKYEWNKDSLKKALKSSKELASIASIKSKPFIRITAKA